MIHNFETTGEFKEAEVWFRRNKPNLVLRKQTVIGPKKLVET